MTMHCTRISHLNLLAGAAACAAALALAPLPAAAADGEGAPAASSPFSASAGASVSNDYTFRGISQTGGEAAFQAWGEVDYNMFYAGIWGSNVDFGKTAAGRRIADVEVDFSAGVRPSWNNVDFDFGVIYYVYPGAIDPAGEFNYVELKAAASAPIVDKVSLDGGLYYSPDFFGSVGAALYAETNLTVELPYDLAASGGLGYQWFDNPTQIDYLNWNAGISWTYKDTVTVDLRYHDTDISRTTCGSKNCDARFMATVSMAIATK